jgi:hypothetical protein
VAAEGITCIRCNRLRMPQQVVVVEKTKGATIYRCADKDECDEYQRQQKLDATWQRSELGPR